MKIIIIIYVIYRYQLCIGIIILYRYAQNYYYITLWVINNNTYLYDNIIIGEMVNTYFNSMSGYYKKKIIFKYSNAEMSVIKWLFMSLV